ncbi:hypothetical protein C0995_005128 [Termitomyces sp. Mi166|nr:hypothetical protein C0995_005128 [Termitomyces sp. Mi166\
MGIFLSSGIAIVPGGTTYEATQLNIESLWSGGPFSDPVQHTLSSQAPLQLILSYSGGNKQPNDQFTTAQVMNDICQQIFWNSTGDISSTVSNYGHYLDLDEAMMA